MAKALKRIFLIRHANSKGNEDLEHYKVVPDHAIDITEEGENQGVMAGAALADYLDSISVTKGLKDQELAFRLWCSSYVRTRRTRDKLREGFGEVRANRFWRDSRENIVLAEQNFGLFCGLTEQEKKERYPDIYEQFQLCEKYQGRFWAKPPNGESRYDVCLRVSQIFGTLMRDAEKEIVPVENVVIVSHGTTIRAFIMQFLHKEFEWFEDEPNPNNCSIRLIEEGPTGRYEDCGYIFEGFPDQEAIRKSHARLT